MRCIGALQFLGRQPGLPLFYSSPSTYTILDTLLFVEPTNVGPTITMMEPAPIAEFVLELFQTHAENLRSWKEYNDVDRAIKRVIKIIVPEAYF